jgi:hypothetical protein
MNKRFIKTTSEEVGEGEDPILDTQWWLDTMRPIKEKPFFVTVECYKDKDPNDFVKCEGMQILFNDQAEYYFVCKDCYNTYRGMQFSGSTRGGSGWRERAEKKRDKHEQTKGWCEFCDPIFGNGGWI